ncbi:hypothetical protein [Clostridium sp.]|uniref:hypothetical protein n=1 Tax=Clostridium sp. TaxID=1506 RepID=UPI00284D38D7|nr:hypothetical protein [Clostridium sp.]MDR3594627.1 hypothetical protein [Clostridium sp.]
MQVCIQKDDMYVCDNCKEIKVCSDGLLYFQCCNTIYCRCKYDKKKEELNKYPIDYIGCINDDCYYKLCEHDYWR